MAFKPSVTVFDACILYPFHLRNIVVQAAVDRLVESRWTDAIHDEWIRNLAGSAAVSVERLQATPTDERGAAADDGQRVQGTYLGRHSARPERSSCRCGRHCGRCVLRSHLERPKKFGLRKETPDTFLSSLYDEVPDLVIGSLANARRNLTKTQISASGFIDILKNQKLSRPARQAQRYADDL